MSEFVDARESAVAGVLSEFCQQPTIDRLAAAMSCAELAALVDLLTTYDCARTAEFWRRSHQTLCPVRGAHARAHTTAAVTVDEHSSDTGQDRTLTRIVRLRTDTAVHMLRARVRRNVYEFQSHARADLLVASRDWIPLLEELPEHWFADTAISGPTVRPARVQLAPIAARLVDRAAAVLG